MLRVKSHKSFVVITRKSNRKTYNFQTSERIILKKETHYSKKKKRQIQYYVYLETSVKKKNWWQN